MMAEEKKVSQAQRKATDKYLEKFDEIRIRVPKGQKAEIQDYAAAQGKSVNTFAWDAIQAAMGK